VKTIYYFVLIVALTILVDACSMRNTTSQPISDQTVTSTIQPPGDVANMAADRPPSYQGITPGVSHKRDVLAKWGNPNVIRTHKEYKSLHYFSDYGIEMYFLVKNDVVWAVTSNDPKYWLTRDGNPATVDDLSQLLGSSDVITPTFGYPIRAFPRYGLAISKHSVPFPYQFFMPTNLQEYQALWGEFPLGYDPFPLIPSVEAVGINPGETTREQVAQLLGNPDYIAFEDRNVPWLYYLEPDMLGRLRVFFNADDIVENMAIKPLYQTHQTLLLEDAVNSYGEPDILQLIPGFEGQKYETLALLYLDRGLRVATRCVTSTCEIVKRDAKVNQKWYFQPTTLAEYQAAFPDPEAAFVEWHGFDE
jgi:hypothetical protein